MTQTELTNLPPTISVEEAGELLGLSRPSSYIQANRYLETGEGIPCLRFGRKLRVPTARLLVLLGVEQETGGTGTVVPIHRTQS